MRDIYYVLFRHKWMIAILTVLGVVGSFGVYTAWPFPYISRAKIFIRYVQNTTPPAGIDSATRVQSPDTQGNKIMNTELETLTSMDLAVKAATKVGPENVLGKGKTNVFAAAGLIAANLKADVPKDSDVIVLEFKANDPTILQPVLAAVIAAYKDKYQEMHLTPGFTESNLSYQTEMAKGQLNDAMNALRDEKKRMGITDLEDAKKSVADQRARTEEGVFQVETEMAQLEEGIKELRERIPSATTNAMTADHSTNIAVAAPPQPSEDEISKYKELVEVRDARRAAERAWLNQFNEGSTRVVNARKLREQAEANLKAFENEHPGVLAVKAGDSNRVGPAGGPPVTLLAALQDATGRQRVLQAKYAQLTNHLAEIKRYSDVLAEGENRITQAETERKVADAKYEQFRLATEAESIANVVDNKVSGISTGEAPTPPFRDSKQIMKATFGVLGVCLLLAFGLPFFIEMVLDQSLKSPMDVQARIPMPLFINFPKTNGHSLLSKLKPSKQVPLLTNQNGSPSADGVTEQGLLVARHGNGKVEAWDERHELRPHFETLRDRLMTYFEMINLTHKPKLVAVTSCNAGAGVTTTAAGLASSLSEIGDGNVLLVSMNDREGEAQRFYKGKLTFGIEEVLQKENRDQAQVQNNLFVAKEGQTDDRLPRVLPKRFSHLVPLLKASDYDYIIFDMPPVNEISITPRLARFMDMVLLVIESGKTSRDAAARVASVLAESKTNVGMVLNKNRSYMPKRLEQSM